MPGASLESLDGRPLAIEGNQVATGRPFMGLLVLFVLALPGSSVGQSAAPNRAQLSVPPGPATFNRDIAPIIFTHCSPCHRPGQPGPFDLLNYADVKRRTKEIAKVTLARAMPPWLPEPGYGEFKEERRLTEAEIHRIRDWIDGGAVEGRPADLPALPPWTEGWQLGEPDLVL